MMVLGNNEYGEFNGAEETKGWNLCRMPFWHQGSTSSSSSLSHRQSYSHSSSHRSYNSQQESTGGNENSSTNSSFSAVAKALLPTKRRLKLDPDNKLYFPYEPGKQVSSAIRIVNVSRSNVAFKFQTTAPKSCFMRPPGGMLTPGESLIATD
eukprot:TRINITY_DN1889_c0_g1_i4.p1 TRINITY_DN1889_c0_g1~~TRINITY_DN1889_c0_g1_i4.p1  ORF type:complete len:152 (+),score=13.73 TRINITY_DN1889_c0_g1_i4:425-880(+)